MSLKIFERNATAIEEAANKNTEKSVEKKDKVYAYRCKEGKTVVRVMGPYNESGVWYREFLEHQVQINGRWVYTTCARPYGQRCVMCERGEDLHRQGGEENIRMASAYRPKTQVLLNVIVLSDPDGDQRSKGIQTMKSGITVNKALLKYDAQPIGDEGYGDITSLPHGFNIAIERSEVKGKTDYTVMPSRNRSNITELLAKDGMDITTFTMHNLDELLPPQSPEEVAALLEGVNRVPGFPVYQGPKKPVVGNNPPQQVVVTNPAETPVLPPRPQFITPDE
jgi:hypothetical protein